MTNVHYQVISGKKIPANALTINVAMQTKNNVCSYIFQEIHGEQKNNKPVTATTSLTRYKIAVIIS